MNKYKYLHTYSYKELTDRIWGLYECIKLLFPSEDCKKKYEEIQYCKKLKLKIKYDEYMEEEGYSDPWEIVEDLLLEVNCGKR